LVGIIQSMLFAFGYVYLRKSLIKWIAILGCNKNCINFHFLPSLCERWYLMLRVLQFQLIKRTIIMFSFQVLHVQELPSY
jgi:hypothetical protein